MARILGVGIATLDIINSVNGYPAEDSEVRASDQRICRGGNCTNTLVVLSQLGHQCSWSGTLVEEPDARHILADLQHYNISSQYCDMKTTGKVPVSYITLNTINGSRSIVHYRDLDELSFEFFRTIELADFDWVHFEGRNVSETLLMISHLKSQYPQLPCSLEVEKVRPDIEQLYEHVDVIIFSKAFCHAQGFTEADEFLTHIKSQYTNKIFILAWGETGSYAATDSATLLFEPAVKLKKVTDTLGAGDTFNAGIIDALISNLTAAEALQSANKLAAFKCTTEGFDISQYEK